MVYEILCVGLDYFVTEYVGDTMKSCEHYPKDYTQQLDRIVTDMQSVGIRHNDMLKQQKFGSSDIVISKNRTVYLTDFGWGTVDGSLATSCRIDGRLFEARNFRPRNPIIVAGFGNIDERQHTHPCTNRLMKPTSYCRKNLPPTDQIAAGVAPILHDDA